MPADHATHHLESFVRQTFGDWFGAVLLAGYGADAGCGESLVLAAPGGRLIRVTGDLPHGWEPLVLAALLKLLLSRPDSPAELAFDTREVIAELGWPETKGARGAVDDATSTASSPRASMIRGSSSPASTSALSAWINEGQLYAVAGVKPDLLREASQASPDATAAQILRRKAYLEQIDAHGLFGACL